MPVALLAALFVAVPAAFAADPAPPADPAPQTRPEAPAPLTRPEPEPAATPIPEVPPVQPEKIAPKALTLEDLERRLIEQDQKIAEQQAALTQLNQQVVETRLKMIPKDTWKFSIEGFYRTRAYLFSNLFQAKGEGVRDSRFLEHRLRLIPGFAYKDVAKFKMLITGMEDTVWGDNAANSQTALFASTPSNTGPTGLETPSLALQRAWLEFNVPVGSVRVGRMGFHWGMGLLANDGDGFRNTFGEARVGSTIDRVMFATKPISVVQKILGRPDSNIPLFAVIAVDRLVEDPLVQYYGFQCTENIYSDNPLYDPKCDTDGDGRTEGHGYTDDGFTADQRNQDWWSDQNDDVMQMVYTLIYRAEDQPMFGTVGDLHLGGLIVNRIQKETESNVVIADVYGKLDLYGAKLEFEGIHIGGKTRAIALPGAVAADAADPLAKNANIWGGSIRGGYGQEYFTALVEAGYASGDDNAADEKFTGRPLHQDFNVGLLLYEEVLARVTQQLWGPGANGLWSRGGVYNSSYLYPNVTVTPAENWSLTGAMLLAWPDKPDGALIQCREGEGCAQALATKDLLGWEAGLALKHTWHQHLKFSLETAYAKATDRVPLAQAGLNPKGNFFTLQSRIAWEF